ncbi:hypothetical protein KJI95_17515 [Shewanella sp. JM162201]|uniref:Uncharacterized protein n=1 Tax=Shewanella jiangmenensis TaxID=2837387 RepID=A0ABS5V7A6_9GAMM|nr:hypothetical protein [Shewanella jiangmenensis]MBT1446295.1 hypothetical protein [Shewanella jiangmenensis]
MLNWFTNALGITKKSQRKKVQVDIPFEHLQNEPRSQSPQTPSESNKQAPKDP